MTPSRQSGRPHPGSFEGGFQGRPEYFAPLTPGRKAALAAKAIVEGEAAWLEYERRYLDQQTAGE